MADSVAPPLGVIGDGVLKRLVKPIVTLPSSRKQHRRAFVIMTASVALNVEHLGP